MTWSSNSTIGDNEGPKFWVRSEKRRKKITYHPVLVLAMFLLKATNTNFIFNLENQNIDKSINHATLDFGYLINSHGSIKLWGKQKKEKMASH